MVRAVTPAQVLALLAYIDAAVEASRVQGSCGPHVAPTRQRRVEARRAVQKEFGL